MERFKKGVREKSTIRDNLMVFLLVVWFMAGQASGGVLWLWLTDIDHRSTGWQWIIGIVGIIPFLIGGIVFAIAAAFALEAADKWRKRGG